MPKGLVWGLAAVIGAAALAAGVWQGASQRTATPSVEKAVAALIAAPLTELAGGKDTLSRWQGKILVVNFWATWCPPCREEIPGLIRTQTKLGVNGIQIVGIAIDSAEKTREYAGNIGINYPLFVGGMETIDLARGLGNKTGGLPFTVVLDRHGQLVTTHLGIMTEADLARIVAALPG